MSKKFCPNHPSNKLWSQGMCIVCYRKQYAKPLKKTPLAPISNIQKNMLAVYRMQRRAYLREHPYCQIQLDGCTRKATEIHHSAKKYSKKLWLDQNHYVGTCRNCHQKVENSPDLAREKGIYNYKILNEEDTFNMSNDDHLFYDALKQIDNFETGSL